MMEDRKMETLVSFLVVVLILFITFGVSLAKIVTL
jgi:hypothetical protein